MKRLVEQCLQAALTGRQGGQMGGCPVLQDVIRKNQCVWNIEVNLDESLYEMRGMACGRGRAVRQGSVLHGSKVVLVRGQPSA